MCMGVRVPSLPKRNGNRTSTSLSLTSSGFPAYLRGMETISTRSGFCGETQVPSLPKRNGNAVYRELRGFGTRVPSLPKRNGNESKAFNKLLQFLRFPAYLRGMETREHNEIFVHGLLVPSLPKRNGNGLSAVRTPANLNRSQPT